MRRRLTRARSLVFVDAQTFNLINVPALVDVCSDGRHQICCYFKALVERLQKVLPAEIYHASPQKPVSESIGRLSSMSTLAPDPSQTIQPESPNATDATCRVRNTSMPRHSSTGHSFSASFSSLTASPTMLRNNVSRVGQEEFCPSEAL